MAITIQKTKDDGENRKNFENLLNSFSQVYLLYKTFLNKKMFLSISQSILFTAKRT